jgi:hypothetical protein
LGLDFNPGKAWVEPSLTARPFGVSSVTQQENSMFRYRVVLWVNGVQFRDEVLANGDTQAIQLVRMRYSNATGISVQRQ